MFTTITRVTTNDDRDPTQSLPAETPAALIAALPSLPVDPRDVEAVARRLGLAQSDPAVQEVASQGLQLLGRMLLSDLLQDAAPDVKEALLESPNIFGTATAFLDSMNASLVHTGNGGGVIIIDPRLPTFLLARG